MRTASVHKIGSDAFRVSFSIGGPSVAEVVVSTGGSARHIKRQFELDGTLPHGTVSLLEVGQSV